MENDYKIMFGKTEKESSGGHYNHLTVSLGLTAAAGGTSSLILFIIEEGYPEGQFDMKRISTSKAMTIDEAEQLVKKLNEFIERGKSFLSDYKQ